MDTLQAETDWRQWTPSLVSPAESAGTDFYRESPQIGSQADARRECAEHWLKLELQ
jgi:hypothetical protein